MPQSAWNRQRLAFTCAIAIGAIAIAYVVVFPAYLAYREAKYRMDRSESFKRLMNGLITYHDNNRKLPDAVKVDAQGRELYSWRVSLVPFLWATKDTIDMELPWTALRNHAYFLRAPFYDFKPRDDPDHSDISAVVGADTAFRTHGSLRLDDVRPDTILLIELPAKSSHWMEPGDIAPEEIAPALSKLTSSDTFLVGFADGEIWMFDHALPPERLLPFCSAHSGVARDRAVLLEPYKK